MDSEIIARLAKNATSYAVAHSFIMLNRGRNDYCSVRSIMAKSNMTTHEISEALSFLGGPFGSERGYLISAKYEKDAGITIKLNSEFVNMIKMELKDETRC